MNSVRARAKINLTLNVRPLPEPPDQRAASPYHQLSSVFHLIELADELSWEPAERFSLTCVGQGLDDLPITENLAWQAACAFAEATRRALPALHVHIEKHIPSGAGLGGGSADAAAMLLLLAHESGMSDAGLHEARTKARRVVAPYRARRQPECSPASASVSEGHGSESNASPDNGVPGLRQIAAGLGADVGFFLADSAACLMGGIGDEVRGVLRPAAGVPVVIAWDPTAPVSTPQVYQAFEQRLLPVDSAGEAALVDVLEPHPSSTGNEASGGSEKCAGIEQLAPHLYNNLSAAAFAISPAAHKVFEFLDSAPQSSSVALSGTGGASFALCASWACRDALARDVRAAGFAASATELAGQTLSEQFASDQKAGRK
ncbi:MAG: hypothetical protein FWD65_01670 [Coriobacteriia bacterium]|nr:hypothetical protein [Coriobacteriia bacterium]